MKHSLGYNDEKDYVYCASCERINDLVDAQPEVFDADTECDSCGNLLSNEPENYTYSVFDSKAFMFGGLSIPTLRRLFQEVAKGQLCLQDSDGLIVLVDPNGDRVLNIGLRKSSDNI